MAVLTGVVVAGAGARGAYEAGALSVLLPELERQEPDQRFVVVGTSAGAINAAVLASTESPKEGADALTEFWDDFQVDDVIGNLAATGAGDALKYLFEVVCHWSRLDSLLDSTPLRKTLADRIQWDAVDRNVGRGWIDRVGIVCTCCDNGRTTVFTKGAPPTPADNLRGIDYVPVTLGPEHVSASTALPIVFRPAPIEGPGGGRRWYVDGGVNLNAPIKPAIDLGADRVAVVATNPDPDRPQSAPFGRGEPDVFDIGGAVVRSLLVDNMSEDVRTLRKVNRLVVAAGAAQPRPAGAATSRQYTEIPSLYIGPPGPDDISRLANRVYGDRYDSVLKLTTKLGLLGRVIGGSADSHGDLMSFLFVDKLF
ncbi:MAG TPA: patatin-like phospholipase family protein, partial [Acidimicrobiales bacterium]